MGAMTRRRFLRYGAGAGAALAVPWLARVPAASAASGAGAEEVRRAGAAAGRRHRRRGAERNERVLVRSEGDQSRQLHPDLPPTPLWAYDDGSGLAGQSGSFGMAVVAQSGTPLRVEYTHSFRTRTRAGFRSTRG